MSDLPFVTFCAVATLLMHKMRQALRARKYRLSKCWNDAAVAARPENGKCKSVSHVIRRVE